MTRYSAPSDRQSLSNPAHSDTVEQLTLSPEEVTEQYGLRSFFPPTLVALYDNNYGLFLIAVSQLFFAGMSMSVKYLMTNTDMSTLSLIFIRMIITCAGCIVTLLVTGDPNPILGPEGVRHLLIGRGVFGFAGLVSGYQALRGLTISDAVTIQFLAPSVTALFSYVILNESFKFKEALAGAASLVGVVLISRPPFIFGSWSDSHPSEKGLLEDEADESALRLVSVSWALVSVVMSAAAYLLIRCIGKRASPLHSIGYFSMMCTVTSGIVIAATPARTQWVDSVEGCILIVIIGIFGFCAQTLLTMGLQREKAGRAGLAMYLQIFFAVILDFIVFQNIPSFLSFLGTVVILASAVWVALSSSNENAPNTVSDPESRPISRSPSPAPPGQKTVRGEQYSYSSVPAPTSPPSSSSLLVPENDSVSKFPRRLSTSTNA